MKKVFVNGYGSIGSRVAKFIKDDPDIQIIGVGKYSPDKKVQSAIDNGFSVYVPKNKIDDFKEYEITGSIESALDDCDLVIDASPGGQGYLNKKNIYEPKDIMAILNIAQENEVNLSLIQSVITSNQNRKVNMVQKIKDAFGASIQGKKIAVLGLAFKANTDDIRYSPATVIVEKLSQEGAHVVATDPAAIENSRRELKGCDNIAFCEDRDETIKEADLIVIVTEWDAYRNLDLEKVKTLTKARKIVDLRNILDAKKVRDAGFEYFSIGQKTVSNY